MDSTDLAQSVAALQAELETVLKKTNALTAAIGQAGDKASDIAGAASSHGTFFLTGLTVFVLAVFVGYMVVWNVTPALHTPLMSVTNAISSIIAIGALLQIWPAGAPGRPDILILLIAFVGLTLTSINMFGGFAVTRRMLAMFQK